MDGGNRELKSTDTVKVAICYDQRMERHNSDKLHPERPDRVRSIWDRLNTSDLIRHCKLLRPKEAAREEILECHSEDMLKKLDEESQTCQEENNSKNWDQEDVYINAHSAECARISAGCCIAVATAVASGAARAGVAVVRPPGHHAKRNQSMGFCLLNNAAIAARAAQKTVSCHSDTERGTERILILDWDGERAPSPGGRCDHGALAA